MAMLSQLTTLLRWSPGPRRFRPAGSISFPSSWASALAPIFVASRTGLPAPTIRFRHRFPRALTASPTSRSRATPAERVLSVMEIYRQLSWLSSVCIKFPCLLPECDTASAPYQKAMSCYSPIAVDVHPRHHRTVECHYREQSGSPRL